jgi:hypothetical protein
MTIYARPLDFLLDFQWNSLGLMIELACTRGGELDLHGAQRWKWEVRELPDHCMNESDHQKQHGQFTESELPIAITARFP